MGANISGVLKAKDGNLWVSTTGTPNKIAKVSSSTYAVIKENEITEGKVGAGWGATPGITAKGDTLYYSNAGTTIYRHIFSTEESKMIIDAKTVVPNANMIYNNIAVHPISGKVYMTTIKGYGWDFLTNNISEFDFSGAEPKLSENYTDQTYFPAGIFFSADFQ
jgi:DNA-binding beta-propeller fold protein YncE